MWPKLAPWKNDADITKVMATAFTHSGEQKSPGTQQE